MYPLNIFISIPFPHFLSVVAIKACKAHPSLAQCMITNPVRMQQPERVSDSKQKNQPVPNNL